MKVPMGTETLRFSTGTDEERGSPTRIRERSSTKGVGLERRETSPMTKLWQREEGTTGEQVLCIASRDGHNGCQETEEIGPQQLLVIFLVLKVTLFCLYFTLVLLCPACSFCFFLVSSDLFKENADS